MKRVALALSFVLFLALAAGQPTARAMQDAAFARLLNQLDGAFSSDQLDLIRFAVDSTTVRTDQLARMLEQLTFASTQLEAVAIVADHLEDPESASVIVDTFTFSSDKRAAQELLRRASTVRPQPVGATTGPRPEPSRAETATPAKGS